MINWKYLSNKAAFIIKGFTNRSVREYYDSVAVNYDIAMKKHDEFVSKVIGYVPECETALDIAMGTGITSKHLRKKCKTVVSLDFSDSMISEGRKKLGLEAKILKADFLQIPLKDGGVEVSVCTAAISHIPKESYDQYFSEISRVTKKYFVTHAKDFNPFERLIYKFYDFGMSLLGHNERMLNFDLNKLSSSLSNNGFNDIALFPLKKNSYVLIANKNKEPRCHCPR